MKRLLPISLLLCAAVTCQAAGNLTPAFLRSSNACYVSYGLNTNVTLSVSNAGLAAVNGLYRTNLLNGYTQGVYKIAWADSFGGFVISNATQIVYGFDEFGGVNLGDGQIWAYDALGNPPTPTSWWGPITNCFTFLLGAPLATSTLSSNYYVEAWGNDTNAVRGDPHRPWRNLQSCLSQTIVDGGNCTVFVGAGNFPERGSINFDVTNRVKLKGAGRGITFIGTEGGADESIRCGSEVVLADFTSYGLPNIGSLGIISTNSRAERCEFNAGADAVYVSSFETRLMFDDCDLKTRYDGLADWESRPGGSNRVIQLYNCRILCSNAVSGILQGITGGDNRIEMYGGSIEAYDAVGRTFCGTLDVDTFRTNKTGSLLLHSVRLRHRSINGVSALFTNFYRLPIKMINCTEEIIPVALTSGSFTNGWEHQNVAIPNGSTRTNRLVDTRTLTNALVAATEQGHRVTVFDSGMTASGTNIWLATSANQKILAGGSGIGPKQTNITANGGSLTLAIVGTNWQVVSRFP